MIIWSKSHPFSITQSEVQAQNLLTFESLNIKMYIQHGI